MPEVFARPEQTQSIHFADAQKLREAIQNIDAMSQEGFSEIRAIARLALMSLLTPEGQRDTESLAYAFQAICGKADQSGNSINWEAEQVGCNHSDAAMIRRFDAYRSAEAMRRALEVSHG
ncbi:hypothetical protein ACNRBS_10535 [Ralstonia pseudosolanacearum]|uniref:Uncharacterized protein n=1 Tax=Ralstonia solanacearum TaxID=305 RepID=A0A0S4V478_RALSL|nr:hypothetical protein [Ralstonia pseudosolanacearum]CUV28873.1 conserved protein of unknown function [Ralstonia solanacearum]BCL91935.1 hypothetical protein MAFF211479_16360 [Ralstonia solanacearum]BCL97765.1 hypothetical protein MAFF211491_22170 [Ralstonia solanacearum]BCM13207.1 hypothetical protein MAFF241648_23970 [Ralstonia solanacearum]BCN04499.1 hypothetical protein RPSB_16360 [Ralstonia solanacearum]